MPFDELPQRTWEGNKRLACRVIASVSFFLQRLKILMPGLQTCGAADSDIAEAKRAN